MLKLPYLYFNLLFLVRQRRREGSGSPNANLGRSCTVIDVPESTYKCFSKCSLCKLWNKDTSTSGAREEEGGSGFVLASGAKILNIILYSDSHGGLKDPSHSHIALCS